MNFIGHIKAVYEALRLVESAGAEAAVARASWHLCLAHGTVVHGWGIFPQIELYALISRAARKRLVAVAHEHKVYGAYWEQCLLWNHWRLPGRAPELAGVKGFNLHWGYDK